MIHFYCFLSLKTFQSQVHGMNNLMIPFSHVLKVSVINFCSWAPALNMHDCIKTEKSHLFRSSQYDNTSSEDCPWKPAGNVWEISPKIWAFKPQESNLTTGRNDTKNIFSRQQQPQLLNCVCSASSQCLPPARSSFPTHSWRDTGGRGRQGGLGQGGIKGDDAGRDGQGDGRFHQDALIGQEENDARMSQQHFQIILEGQTRKTVEVTLTDAFSQNLQTDGMK